MNCYYARYHSAYMPSYIVIGLDHYGNMAVCLYKMNRAQKGERIVRTGYALDFLAYYSTCVAKILTPVSKYNHFIQDVNGPNVILDLDILDGHKSSTVVGLQKIGGVKSTVLTEEGKKDQFLQL